MKVFLPSENGLKLSNFDYFSNFCEIQMCEFSQT